MRIIPVHTAEAQKAFMALPSEIYKADKHWIRPLIKDELMVFDPEKNKLFSEGGEVRRWILIHELKTIGRIAAFVNPKTATKNNSFPVGGTGFFECIDNQQAANLLFDTAKEWLMKKGMESMDGPINFGERDKFWGLLVEGNEKPPNYQTNYHPIYYKALFEGYGFKVYFKQFTYALDCKLKVEESFFLKGNKVLSDPAYHFEHLRKNNLAKYTEDFRTVYNNAWVKHIGVAEMTVKQATSIMKQLKPIIEEKLIWFGYHNNKPITFFINLPEVNQLFKHVNGKLNFFGKLKFVWHRFFYTNTKALGLVFGVDPAYDGKGVTQAITLKMHDMFSRNSYEQIELNWIGDFNPRMIAFAHKIGEVSLAKVHHTYRYNFDRSIPFERMPVKAK